jgi:hypothetical protein
MDGELSYLTVAVVVVVVVIVMVDLSRNATSMVRLGTLPVNVVCGLVQEVLAVKDVAAGAVRSCSPRYHRSPSYSRR